MKRQLLMLVQKLKSKVYDYHKFLLVGSALLLLLTAAGIYFSTTNQVSKEQSKAVCKASDVKTTELLRQKKYDELQKQLNESQENCRKLTLNDVKAIKDPANVKGYTDLFIYKANLARATYMGGDKKQAAVYADEALKLNKELFGNHNTTVPGQNLIYFDLLKIKSGSYSPRDEQGLPL